MIVYLLYFINITGPMPLLVDY